TCLQRKPVEESSFVGCEGVNVIGVILFNLFIKNNASLKSLYISITDEFTHQFFKSCDMNNSNFISEIEILSFNNFTNSIYMSDLIQIQTFLSSLSSLST